MCDVTQDTILEVSKVGSRITWKLSTKNWATLWCNSFIKFLILQRSILAAFLNLLFVWLGAWEIFDTNLSKGKHNFWMCRLESFPRKPKDFLLKKVRWRRISGLLIGLSGKLKIWNFKTSQCGRIKRVWLCWWNFLFHDGILRRWQCCGFDGKTRCQHFAGWGCGYYFASFRWFDLDPECGNSPCQIGWW